MSVKFNRVYRIGFRVVTKDGYEALTQIQTPVEGQEGYEGLQMKADIKLSTETGGVSGQSGKLVIFNLSEEQRNTINGVDKGYVTIQAGYGDPFKVSVLDELPTLYLGDIQKVTTSRVGDDFITTITMQTGKLVDKIGKLERTFERGKQATVGNIAKEIARTFVTSLTEIGIGNYPLEIKLLLSDTLLNRDLPLGWVAEGKTSDELTRFLEQYNCDWTIINEVLYIKEKNKDVTKPTNTLTLNPNAVKGRITKVTDSVGIGADTTKPNLQVSTLLEPEISPRTKVNITKDLYLEGEGDVGDYVVVTVATKLDYRGNSWDSLIELKQPDISEES